MNSLDDKSHNMVFGLVFGLVRIGFQVTAAIVGVTARTAYSLLSLSLSLLVGVVKVAIPIAKVALKSSQQIIASTLSTGWHIYSSILSFGPVTTTAFFGMIGYGALSWLQRRRGPLIHVQESPSVRESPSAGSKTGRDGVKKGNGGDSKQGSSERVLKSQLMHMKQELSQAQEAEYPANWCRKYAGNDLAVFPMKPDIVHALQSIFDVEDTHNLGRGRDVQHQWSGSGRKELELAAAWRVENPRLWKQYRSARDSVMHELNVLRDKYNKYTTPLKTWMDAKLGKFRHLTKETLEDSWNEKFLLHGTSPKLLLTILSNGLSDKFSDGLFGHGVYLAETPTKNDQYTSRDESRGTDGDAVAALHDRLYRSSEHPGNVHYLILCRVVMGHYDRTDDGSTSLDNRCSLWAPGAQDKELSTINGTVPGIHHHSLVVETGNLVARHREFLQYHKPRVYPAYVLAYHRKVNGRRL